MNRSSQRAISQIWLAGAIVDRAGALIDMVMPCMHVKPGVRSVLSLRYSKAAQYYSQLESVK